jgi:hypothetical protein
LRQLLRVPAVVWTNTRELVEVFELDPREDVSDTLLNLLGSKVTAFAAATARVGSVSINIRILLTWWSVTMGASLLKVIP